MISNEVKHTLIVYSTIFLLVSYSKEIKTYAHIVEEFHGSNILTSWKVARSQMLTEKILDKQIVVY